MSARLVWFVQHPKKRQTVAPMPLPEAIPVEEAEVAAVLAEVRREIQATTARDNYWIPTTPTIVNGMVEPTMAEVVIIDDWLA